MPQQLFALNEVVFTCAAGSICQDANTQQAFLIETWRTSLNHNTLPSIKPANLCLVPNNSRNRIGSAKLSLRCKTNIRHVLDMGLLFNRGCLLILCGNRAASWVRWLRKASRIGWRGINMGTLASWSSGWGTGWGTVWEGGTELAFLLFFLQLSCAILRSS